MKLKEKPSLVELSKQMELVNNSFTEICHSGKDLTIRLQKVAPDANSVERNFEGSPVRLKESEEDVNS